MLSHDNICRSTTEEKYVFLQNKISNDDSFYQLIESSIIIKNNNNCFIMEKKDRINMFLATNRESFPPMRIPEIKERLENADDSLFTIITTTEFKKPDTMFIISILIGELGIDRFMLNDSGMGVLKLLTCGCCGVLWIIDIINIKKMTMEYNYKKFNEMAMTIV